jgi:hypothetical protein
MRGHEAFTGGGYACIAWVMSSAIPNLPSLVNSGMGFQSGF